jgi:hypothetical protein
MNGVGGGEKTQPTRTVLEDVVVDEVEEVSLLEAVEMRLEDVVVDEVEEVSLVEVVDRVEDAVEPPEPRKMPTPAATATSTTTATTMTILPIPMREVLAINRQNKRCSIFKTSQGGSTVFEATRCDLLPSNEMTVPRSRR